MKNVLNMTQEQVNAIGQLTEDERVRLIEEEDQIEREIQQELEDITPEMSHYELKMNQPSSSEISIIGNLNSQLGSGGQKKGAVQDDSREML